MALPTAATAGYGFYPTVGPTPDVACNCLREWLPVFRRLLRFKGYGDVDVWQCTGDLGSSGGTHSRGGAFDYSGISFNKAMLAREMGAYATWPRNWTGNRHTHGVLSECPHNDPAAYQLVAMRIYRRDGLGYLGLAGPDPLPKPSRYRSWRQGIEWAEAQMGNTTTSTQQEDDMPYTDWPAEDKRALAKDVANQVRYTQIGSTGKSLQTILLEVLGRVDALEAAVKATPEGVGYSEVGATGKSIDTYLLAINSRLANIEKKLGS